MDYGGASEVLGQMAAGISSGVAGNTDILKMANKQMNKPTIDSVPDKVIQKFVSAFFMKNTIG